MRLEKATSGKLLGGICVAILCGILVAGLWPFHGPENEVSWISNGNGVRFGEYGTILSSRKFAGADLPNDGAASIEIWLQPALVSDSSTLLTFAPGHPFQFSLRQSLSDLAVVREARGTFLETIYVDSVFRRGKLVFITITSGRRGTEVYVDGALVRSVPRMGFSTKDFTGRLVVGDSIGQSDSWSGQLRGLAFYGNELTSGNVLEHYRDWTMKGRPRVNESERCQALYLFNERDGKTVHDQSAAGVDLTIPRRYVVLQKAFLEPIWNEFNLSWGYWKNVLINIGGFVPLGFFFCFYFSWARGMDRAAMITVAAGAIASLTIELLQASLPTRQSGMSDLLTKTLGTWVGVQLYRGASSHAFREMLQPFLNALPLRLHDPKVDV
jgi:hypothetical protein